MSNWKISTCILDYTFCTNVCISKSLLASGMLWNSFLILGPLAHICSFKMCCTFCNVNVSHTPVVLRWPLLCLLTDITRTCVLDETQARNFAEVLPAVIKIIGQEKSQEIFPVSACGYNVAYLPISKLAVAYSFSLCSFVVVRNLGLWLQQRIWSRIILNHSSGMVSSLCTVYIHVHLCYTCTFVVSLYR